MRTILCRLLAFASIIVGTIPVFAQPPPPPLAPPARRIPMEALGLADTLVPRVPPISDKEVAGLTPSSRLDLLTWERVYALALVRGRDRRGPMAEALDTKALDEPAARLGIADFDRFRKDFLAGRPGSGGSFRDPSEDYLDLLRRLQRIDDARRSVVQYETLWKLVLDLIQGESAGLSQLDLDLIQTASLRARQDLAAEIGRFRDRLDDVKVVLGLSPHAPVMPDRKALTPFRTVLEAVENWSRNPDRRLAELRRLAQTFPALGEVVVDGHPILGTLEANPEPGEEVLASAVRLAIKNRGGPAKGEAPGDADVQLELRVRRRLRHLFETRRAYEGAKQKFEFARRLLDQSFEQTMSPSPSAVAGRTQRVAGVLEQHARIRQAEDEIVTVWTSFRAERLAFYRELDVLPYSDWAAFYKDLSAE